MSKKMTDAEFAKLPQAEKKVILHDEYNGAINDVRETWNLNDSERPLNADQQLVNQALIKIRHVANWYIDIDPDAPNSILLSATAPLMEGLIETLNRLSESKRIIDSGGSEKAVVDLLKKILNIPEDSKGRMTVLGPFEL